MRIAVSVDLGAGHGAVRAEPLPVTAVLATGEVRRWAGDIVRPDGSRRRILDVKFPVELDDGEVAVGGFGVDLTELRQAQQALSEITGEFTSDDLLGEIRSATSTLPSPQSEIFVAQVGGHFDHEAAHCVGCTFAFRFFDSFNVGILSRCRRSGRDPRPGCGRCGSGFGQPGCRGHGLPVP